MLELLLKYELSEYLRGTVEIAWPWWALVLGAILVGVLSSTLSGYVRRRQGTPPPTSVRRRCTLAGLRVGMLSLVVFLLSSPELVVSSAEEARPSVVVLLDNSKSMTIDDTGGQSRGDLLASQFAPGIGAVSTQLESRFEVRYYRFGTRTEAVDDPAELDFSDARSSLATGLTRALAAVPRQPLAAVIVVGDGGHGMGSDMDSAMRRVLARGLPVHTVGLGAERFDQDIELAAVRLPPGILKEESAEALVRLRHRGFGGQAVVLEVEDEGVIVHRRVIRLPENGDTLSVQVPLAFEIPGVHRLTFRLVEASNERITENNRFATAVLVGDETMDVLHVEGEPRFEVKFLRRAVAGDSTLRVVSLVRTAENKYYRLGVDNSDELATGFPDSPRELFRYRALVIGSIEATALSESQQDLVKEFVARRGGGLLFLGGRLALGEGGYPESPIHGLLPVVLDRGSRGFLASVHVEPDRAAAYHPLGRLLGTQVTRWENLPSLTVVNPIRYAKPGAKTVLWGTDSASRRWIVLAQHRYGLGRVAVFPVRDSWRWQMHSTIAVEDLTHETFWRQMLRWLARSADGRVRVMASADPGVPGEPVEIRVQAFDETFAPLLDPNLDVSVITPLGDRESLPVSWSVGQEGPFRARLVPEDPGIYEVVATLRDGGPSVASARTLVRVDSEGTEFFGAELKRERLQRLAAETGGRYFGIHELDELAQSLPARAEGREVLTRRPLWNAPVWLLLLLTLVGTEWMLRRRWGMP